MRNRFSGPASAPSRLCRLLALLLPVVAAPAQAQRSLPNVVVILTDDLGYGDLSSYGAPDLRTPHIDALAREGVRFTSFYTNSPVCSPTRASLMTGRYPDLVGVPGVVRTHRADSWGHLIPQAKMLPQLLRDNGYHTALIGKWHLGLESPNLPNERGFDLFRGLLEGMMDDYYTHRRWGLNYMRHNRDEIDPRGHATDLFSDWAAEYVRQRAGTGAPFFLYLAYTAPHTPIQPPEDRVARVKRRERGIDDKRARLVALIEHLDAGVGRVVEALKRTGAYDNTLIVFTSDNGGQLDVGARNGPLRGGKPEMYEGGLRVPAIAVWPGRIPAGREESGIALTMDLFPTVAEAAGVPVDHRIDGRSLLGVLTGGGALPQDRTLVWTLREGGDWYMGQQVWAVRQGNWKLVKNAPGLPFRLFDLASDPLEQHDVAAQHQEVYRRLGEALRRHIQQAGGVAWQRP